MKIKIFIYWIFALFASVFGTRDSHNPRTLTISGASRFPGANMFPGVLSGFNLTPRFVTGIFHSPYFGKSNGADRRRRSNRLHISRRARRKNR